MLGTIPQRKLTGKMAWRALSQRCKRAEAFAWIEIVTLLCKEGHISREHAKRMLHERVTSADVKEFRRLLRMQ